MARVRDVPSENGTTLVPILMMAIFSPEAEVIQVEILSCDVYQPRPFHNLKLCVEFLVFSYLDVKVLPHNDGFATSASQNGACITHECVI